MAQDNGQDLDIEEEEKERAGWPVPLIALFFAAAAAGGGYWLTTGKVPVEVAAKVETTAAKPVEPVPVAATTEAPTKAASEKAETVAAEPAKPAASTSVEVAKTPEPVKTETVMPEVAKAVAAKPEEPAPAPEQAKVEPDAPASIAVEAPKVTAEQPAVAAPEVVAVQPAIEVPKTADAPKSQETQVAVAAASEPVPATKKSEEPAPAAAASELPSFDTVRVEPTGDAVIAGRAAPDAEVTIKLGGLAIGKTKADAQGSFAYVSEKPLPAGAAALSLETNVNGKTVTSEQTVAVAVKGDQKSEPMVAVVKPSEPTKIIQAPKAAEPSEMTDSVKLDAVDYDASGNIIFSGRGKAGAAVRIYVDNTAAGEVKADDAGRWMFAGTSAVAAGTHMLRADEIGANGKVSSRIELPFLREEPAKVAAAPAAVEPTPALPAIAEPAPAAVPTETEVAIAQPAAAPEPSRMVIQPGNNLWKLSRQVYGKGIQYTVIYEANKDQIRDPNLIYPGQVFVMPSAQP